MCKTLCNWRLTCRRMSISASTTFHRIYSRPMPCVVVFPFGISTRKVHINSYGISPVRHMCCTVSTRPIQRSLLGGVFECSPGYISLHHCLKCYAWRWVCPPALCGCSRCTAESTSTSDGILSFTCLGPCMLPEAIQGGVYPPSDRGSVIPP